MVIRSFWFRIKKIIESFASRINKTLVRHQIKLEIVKSTGSQIGILFCQNNIRETFPNTCSHRCEICEVCLNNLRNKNTHIKLPTNGRSYPIELQIYLVQAVEFVVSPVLVCHLMWVKQPQNLIKDLQSIFRSLHLLQSWNTLKWLFCSIFGKYVFKRKICFVWKGISLKWTIKGNSLHQQDIKELVNDSLVLNFSLTLFYLLIG